MNDPTPPNSLVGADSLLREVGLSDLDIEVMAWHFHDCRSLADIGELLGVDRSSVRDRINKCRRKLADAGLPVPQLPDRKPLGRRISLNTDGGDDSLIDALANRWVQSRLLVDKPYADGEGD